MTDYSNQDISGLNLTGANLTGANFTNTNATNVNFTNATITNATFKNTLLTGATISTLTFSNLQKGQLLLRSANLRISAINNLTSLTLLELRTIQPAISPRSLNVISSVSVAVPNNSGQGYTVSVTPTINQAMCIFVATNQNVTIYTSGNIIRTIRSNGTVIQDIDNSNATISYLKIGTVSYRLSNGNADGVIALLPVDLNSYKINEGGISDIVALNTGSVLRNGIGYSWDYILNNSSARIAKVNFGSLNINMLTSRVRGVIHIKIGSGDFGYPIIFFNNNHSYPTSPSNTNELSRTFNITHSSTYSNQSIYANANTTLFTIYQDGSPCFANIAIPNTSSVMTIKFDIDLQKQKDNVSRQTICSGEWTWTSKTVGSAASYIYHGYFQRITELAFTNTLTASYNFDSNANDSSTNGNTLTNVSSVTYNTSDFKVGTAAASFNGSNYFEISNNGRFSPDNLTVTCWVKAVSGSGSYQAIASCRNTGTSVGWMIYISASNNLEIWTGTGSAWSGDAVSLLSFASLFNTWVHISFTLVKSTGAFVLYVNGAVQTTTTRTYVNNTGTNLRIGAGANEQSGAFIMKSGSLLDDFRIYNTALTASDISNIYLGILTSTVIVNNITLSDIGVGGYSNSSPAIENVNMNLEVINLPTFS